MRTHRKILPDIRRVSPLISSRHRLCSLQGMRAIDALIQVTTAALLPAAKARIFLLCSCNRKHAPRHKFLLFWRSSRWRDDGMRNRPNLPSLRQLRAFEAVARRRSIGAAARELGLSQPAVTQMIAQIETALSASLLERRRTGTYLTTLGSVLLPRVQRLFAHIRISVVRSGHRRIAFRARDDEIGGKQDYRYAHPRPHRDRRMRFFRGGGAQARHIPAGAASIGPRSRARGSTKPVPTNGARIGADLAGTRARAPAEGRAQGARIRDR